METTTISRKDFISLAASLHGFCRVLTTTKPQMRKTNNPYHGRVDNITERLGNLGTDYENAVNNQREREGITATFSAESMWKGAGEHVNKGIVRHKGTGENYLVFYPKSDMNGHPMNSDQRWLVDGIPATEAQIAEIKSFMPSRTDSGKQGTEKPVPWRVFNLWNVLEVAVGGKVYRLID